MPIEPITIAITGKGGVGKTTFTGLLIKSLLNQSKKKILIIDADPASNLADILGISTFITVGQIIDRIRHEIKKKSEYYDAGALLEFRLWDEALVEDPWFHFLAMGYTSGRGCYCMINDVLTYLLENLKSYYDLVILDMDAGLEHISRSTKRPINLTFLLTDPSLMGFQTVERIVELARELHNPIEKFILVGNMFPDEQSQGKLQNLAEDLHIPLLGVIPLDKNIARMNLQGESLLNISITSPAYQKIDRFLITLFNDLKIL
ncbi:MAG: AAA family ATPase [Candidatus Helarchaeota archaeon]|nr:AAA family ATPase [Candidatus Helarchaeota archaeon]